MNPFEEHVDVARRVKVIEWLKTEVTDAVSRLFKGLWEGSTAKTADALASLIITCYILGRRVGIPFQRLDEEMSAKLKQLRKEGHLLEERDQDLSALQNHLRKR